MTELQAIAVIAAGLLVYLAAGIMIARCALDRNDRANAGLVFVVVFTWLIFSPVLLLALILYLVRDV